MSGSSGWGMFCGNIASTFGAGVLKVQVTGSNSSPPVADFVPLGMVTV
jgi:hypothetical protein